MLAAALFDASKRRSMSVPHMDTHTHLAAIRVRATNVPHKKPLEGRPKQGHAEAYTHDKTHA